MSILFYLLSGKRGEAVGLRWGLEFWKVFGFLVGVGEGRKKVWGRVNTPFLRRGIQLARLPWRRFCANSTKGCR